MPSYFFATRKCKDEDVQPEDKKVKITDSHRGGLK